MHIIGMMYFSYWIVMLGCFYHVEPVSTLARTCVFGKTTCLCWNQDHDFHVNCSDKNVKKIPKFNDSVVWLDLSHNEIKAIPLKTLPKHLRYLDLSWNEMKYVTRNSFNSSPELRFLDLSYCKIENVEEGTFGELHNLRHLSISFNRKLGFASLPNLTFDLNKTRIRSLHLNGITCMTGAGTILRLHHLRNIRGTNISELSLNSNRLELCEQGVIKHLPKSLKVFSLAKNRLATGAYLLEFVSMTKLKTLNTSFQQNAPKYPECLLDPCRDKREDSADTVGDASNGALENRYDNDYSKSVNWTIPLPPNLEIFDGHFSFLYLRDTDFSVHAPNLLHLYLQKNFIVSLTNLRMKNNRLLTIDISRNFCFHLSPQSLQYFKQLRQLNISHNDLAQDLEKDIEGQLFKNLESLEILDLSFNKISSLPKFLLKNSKKISHMNVSNNRLSEWKVNMSGMSEIKFLDLSQNKLSKLHENALTDIERAFKHSNLSIDLSKNDLDCSCSSQEFLIWMKEYKQHFTNINDYTCSPPNDLFSFKTFEKSIISLSKSCKSYVGWYVGCSVSLAVFLSIVTGRLLVKNKWKIRYIVYKSKQKLGWVKQPNMQGSTSVHYEHDVFLSYSGSTLMFVMNEVIPRLEGNNNMKLVIRDRDYLPGYTKTDNIMHSLHESRKTVCIVSEKYLKSKWRDYELNMAKVEGIIDRGRLDFVILILLPEVYNNYYQSKIMDLVKGNCYIEYPDEPCAYDDFWDKLVNMIES